MNLEDCRKEIDELDSALVRLFCRRMDISGKVAEYKKANNMQIYDSERERNLFDKVEKEAENGYGDYVRRLYGSITALSREKQSALINPCKSLSDIEKAIKDTPALFPQSASVACQGIEGAHSSHACEKLFEKPTIMYCQSFEAVFQSVSSGLCRYGVVPLENSTAGSVNAIYDLMTKYNFSIVRSIKMQIRHSLLAKKGVGIDSVREIYSHPQAIEQCRNFLSGLKNVKIIPCENTAVAAKKVSESERDDIAAISSIECKEQYNLKCIGENIETSNNYTRFICFSKNIEIYPGADRTSLLIKTPHKPGALYNVMAHFYSLGINIIKLESRPIAQSDFEFMFYFDIGVSIYQDALVRVISDLKQSLGEENVKYLGSYREI